MYRHGLDYSLQRAYLLDITVRKKANKMSKKAGDYLSEANAVVPRIDAKEAMTHYGDENSVFVDVRDSGDIAKTGTIKGAVRINRGFMEFAADDGTKFHNPALKKDARILLVCAAGGQAALAGKTLVDMGYQNVINIGGISEWKDAGGEME